MKNKKNILFYSLGLIIFIVSFMLDDVSFLFIDKIRNPVFDYISGMLEHFGNVVIVLILVTSLFLWQEHKRRWIPALLSGFIFTGIVCMILKFSFMRPRPFELVLYGLFGLVSYSFPSLHTAAAFTAIPILNKEFPKLKWFWILFAFIVAFSRVYLKVHYLSDVLGGILIGYLIGQMFVYIEVKYKIFRRLRWSWH